MSSYYDNNKPTVANSRDLNLPEEQLPHFPAEGLYIGALSGGSVALPALYDVRESKGLCFLYNSEQSRQKVNICIEKLVWRIALTTPANLCDLILYNGGNPGDAFNAHSRINKYLFGDRKDRIFFDGNADAFNALLNEAYSSIVDRMSTIRCAGKRDLVELNESLGRDARLKYQFIVLTDFPRHFKSEVAARLAQIVDAGSKAGIYVIMSWDMNADVVDSNASSSSFNPQQLLSSMELLFPQNGNYYFRNSGHDDVLNKFCYTVDSAALTLTETDACLQQIDILAETAKKMMKPTIQQDFDSLAEAVYEPVTSEINVTVGLDVHDKHPVTVRFDSGDYIHGFILGQSGSGKSVLLNNIITSAILKYSPQDLMLYLMDFKGVEFDKYRGVKHTKAVLVDNSDAQMTLEVLRELKEENKKRVELIGATKGVSNIDGYNRKNPENRLPQILFVADECQVMFRRPTGSTDITIQREIAEILDIIATQGRSQGIHMLLATQQLDETDISGQILKNLTECFLLMSAPSDAERLVPDSSDLTSKQMTGLACYYHKKELQSQLQTYFAKDDELEAAIEAAKAKASAIPGNGAHYFSGKSKFSINEEEKNRFFEFDTKHPTAFIGHDIGMKGNMTAIPLPHDFCENILFFGANKEGQTAGVAVSALLSLAILNPMLNVKVIDCYDNPNTKYRELLEKMHANGLCEIVERRGSGELLRQLANDISKQQSRETILLILGSERFAEMKRNSPIVSSGTTTINADKGFSVSSGVVNMDFFIDEDGSTDRFATQIEEQANMYATNDDATADDVVKTFPEALRFILDEGPTQGVHVLLQTDKPTNILFEDYPSETVAMFKHKVILRSENKYLTPMRFSVEIDVEVLSDEEERLRAFYYPEDGGPRLFTPYIIK